MWNSCTNPLWQCKCTVVHVPLNVHPFFSSVKCDSVRRWYWKSQSCSTLSSVIKSSTNSPFSYKCKRLSNYQYPIKLSGHGQYVHTPQTALPLLYSGSYGQLCSKVLPRCIAIKDKYAHNSVKSLKLCLLKLTKTLTS